MDANLAQLTADDHSDHVQISPAALRRAVIAATIGNGIEFYDFVTFAFFAIQIGNTFFPSSSAYLSLMGSLAVFGAGFIARPLGAHILGRAADRRGRKPVMLFSMTLMGCGILLLALTPGYATIGIAAPLIALVARLMQGFALGGEVGSATSYMLEAAPPEKRARTVAWQGISQQIAVTLGSLVGLGLSTVMSDADLNSYGWRIALLLGASIVPFALMIRRTLPETHSTEHAQATPPVPFRTYRRVMVLGFLMMGTSTIGTYIFNYMVTFGQRTIGLSSTISFAGETANNGVGIIAIVLGAVLADRFGRIKVMVIPQAAFLLLIVPCFIWLNTARDATSFICANIIMSLVFNMPWGAAYVAISESLPKSVRAWAFAMVYSVPVAIFGGSTQSFVTWLLHTTGNPMALAWYLTGVTAIGLVAMAMMKETAPALVKRR